ncbi:MAG: MBL fold metallo-hydrolase [Desulfobacterales bacterium]|nr:MBL fold metallo-hydrolase [Desulfobacterales bacterium]
MKKSFIISIISMVLVIIAVGHVWAQKDSSFAITILYDNYVFTEGLEAEWGFSCIIKSAEQTILFDTGRVKTILFNNINKLNVNIKEIGSIVISHNHSDHTGNLFYLLEKNNNASVYLPVSFPPKFVEKVEKTGAKVVSVSKSAEIAKNVFLTGEMGERIKEQALVLNTEKGLVIIVGCSHPGIVNITKKAKEILDKKVYLVFGGFHLLDESDDEIKKVIKQLKELGVMKVGVTHCSGDKAIELFKNAYGENYIKMGVGKK